MNQNKNMKLIGITAEVLSRFHSVSDINFEEILSPYFFLFDHYAKLLPYEKVTSVKNVPFSTPEDIGSLCLDLQEKGVMYHQLKTFDFDDLPVNFRSKSVASKYYSNYVFPYGRFSKVAYFTFMTSYQKRFFYLLNIGAVQAHSFDAKPIQSNILRSERQKLYDEILNRSGCHAQYALAFVSLLPKCYLENFQFHYGIAKSKIFVMRHLSRIYFNRHALFNANILYTLGIASRLGVERLTFQHGASYGQVEPGWSMLAEKSICSRFLTWGFKHESKEERFFSTRLNSQIKTKQKKPEKTALVVLNLIDSDELLGVSPDAVINSLKIVKTLYQMEDVEIKPHPRNEESLLVSCLLKSFNLTDGRLVYGNLSAMFDNYKVIIFTSPDATGFLEALAAGHRPIMAFSKNDYNIKKENEEIYQSLQSRGVWLSEFDTSEQIVFSEPKKSAYNEFRKEFLSLSYFKETRTLIKVLFGLRQYQNSSKRLSRLES